MVTINGYSCVECVWDYVSTMGDRVAAVTRHRLAHLLEGIGWTVGLKGEVERILTAEVNPRELLSKNAFEREKRRRPGTLMTSY